MKKQYLHLSAYPCDLCAGPVIAGFFSVRENEISKATEITQAGATEPARARHLSPVEWDAGGAIAAGDRPTFLNALSHAELR